MCSQCNKVQAQEHISWWVVMRRPLWKHALTLEEVNPLLPFSVCN